ncbi:MAG: hypothetical protein DRN04_00320 [Thermoprotei archaeon]|nr:MAG: hypothetical protein DRN04_00320 [Thermoprotei archaeon]
MLLKRYIGSIPALGRRVCRKYTAQSTLLGFRVGEIIKEREPEALLHSRRRAVPSRSTVLYVMLT